MDDVNRNLIFQLIDGTISADDFERLQDAIENDGDVRAEYLRAVNLSESLTDIAAEPLGQAVAASDSRSSSPRSIQAGSRSARKSPFVQIAVATAALLLVSAIGFWFGQRKDLPDYAGSGSVEIEEAQGVESKIAGHATLRRIVDLKWPTDVVNYREGDVLPDGILQFSEGVAEIDFFCGATLIVEGPAKLNIESDWSVQVLDGRLRASVPPAARGFIVKAAGSEIIDLGTEFVLDVGGDSARVEVVDGEIELRGGQHDGDHLVTGQRQLLKGTAEPDAFAGLSTLDDVQQRREIAAAQRFSDWKAHSEKLRSDDRLIAYFPIADSSRTDSANQHPLSTEHRTVRNVAPTGRDYDGKLLGPVDITTGRFGSESVGLEFDRPGARVRTRIDGEFNQFTFSCWVKIDSLEHVYNALFMSDGYENGELHWQIRNDGRLMFSVMVDDSQKIRHFSQFSKTFVESAGLSKIYFTTPIWDVSKRGQWFHLAAVYDPTTRKVEQYVDGEQLSSEEIEDRFYVDTLRIGPAEIGNWGQPFRKTPWFTVRHLNGTIDELAIFNAALSAAEIKDTYEQGKPLGY